MRDPGKESRLLRELQRIQLKAVRTVAGLYAERELAGGVPNPQYNADASSNWQDCSMRTRAALVLAQGIMAAERAKQSQPTTQVFGMVLMQGRVDDHGKWEQMAAAVSSGKVIEGDCVPQQDVQRGPRSLGPGPQELRADLRQAEAAAEAAEKGAKG